MQGHGTVVGRIQESASLSIRFFAAHTAVVGPGLRRFAASGAQGQNVSALAQPDVAGHGHAETGHLPVTIAVAPHAGHAVGGGRWP
jgi:hypothetical protein